MLLGITKLKPREAQPIIQNGHNFDLLCMEGIRNEIEEEGKRKEAKRS